jgi:ubiquinone/menaquinone biosynthesis C-methylase UbiE
MDVRESYDEWSGQYDSNENKTRDLEGVALRETLSGYLLENGLEVGCGTGKNSLWLQSICKRLLAIDISAEMLSIAKKKVASEKVTFLQANVNASWDFTSDQFDLITFSLVLEHIKDLQTVFEKAYTMLHRRGTVYIGELHPFKQYSGTKARFETEKGMQIVECYNHHVSDFTKAAKKAGFEIEFIEEWFDDNDRENVPRILTMLLKKEK